MLAERLILMTTGPFSFSGWVFRVSFLATGFSFFSVSCFASLMAFFSTGLTSGSGSAGLVSLFVTGLVGLLIFFSTGLASGSFSTGLVALFDADFGLSITVLVFALAVEDTVVFD